MFKSHIMVAARLCPQLPAKTMFNFMKHDMLWHDSPSERKILAFLSARKSKGTSSVQDACLLILLLYTQIGGEYTDLGIK